jgi:hypothetical protein
MRSYLDRLSGRYGLRELGAGYEYLGLCRGVTIHVVEYQGEVALLFQAPQARVGEESRTGFPGFAHWREAGLPPDWLRSRPEDDHSVLLQIDHARLREIGMEKALQAPDLLVQDLHAHGAAAELPCGRCGQRPARVAGLVQLTYAYFCDACWQQLPDREAGGGRRPVRWPWVLPVLVLLSAVGIWGWGMLRQGNRAGGLLPLVPQGNLAGGLLLLVPLVYGWVVATLTAAAARGIRAGLRIAIFLTVLLVVVAGNYWGFQAGIPRQGAHVDWVAGLERYFGTHLADHWQEELPFVLSGLLGVWIGLTWHRLLRRPRVR